MTVASCIRLPVCPGAGLLCDLLWSDPEADISGWAENDRGVSYTFGADVVGKFLQKHDFDLVVRAHQVVEDGELTPRSPHAYSTTALRAPHTRSRPPRIPRQCPLTSFLPCPIQGYEFFADRQLVTIFSAPNYCGEFDNAGAVRSGSLERARRG